MCDIWLLKQAYVGFLYHLLEYSYEAGHESVAVLLPGFAIK